MKNSLHRLTSIFFLLTLCITGCSGGHNPVIAHDADSNQSDEISQLELTSFAPDGHIRAAQSIAFFPEQNAIKIIPERTISTHYDLAWLLKYFPGMLEASVKAHNPQKKTAVFDIKFRNKLNVQLRDVRLMFPAISDLKPVLPDGYTTRTGAQPNSPDPYIAFARSSPLRAIDPEVSASRMVELSYKIPPIPPLATFILDAVVEKNTSEPYDIGKPQLTGRFLQFQISDWQNDIETALINMQPTGFPYELRLSQLGDDGLWGTSIPDIKPGNYKLLVTARSVESPGEIGEGNFSDAFQWINLTWPPSTPLVPLPKGEGMYGFRFHDPDTNLLPSNYQIFMDKLQNKMGIDYALIEFGEICNSGYLAMNDWIPFYIEKMHQYGPNVQLHLNFDNLGFPPANLDPCHHPPEYYTQTFFDNLLVSMRQQVLEKPEFDVVSGFHFDIEIFPHMHPGQELFDIYKRYADFLAKLHLEPALKGRSISVYEFEFHPHEKTGDLAYLCTADFALAASYYTRFTWKWDPANGTPYERLDKMCKNYFGWMKEYGRPYYPILGSFSGWFDDNMDTLQNITICPPSQAMMIDEYCFGNGPLSTVNEWDIIKASDVHNKFVETVITHTDDGTPIFPSNGFAVYRLGDLQLSTVGDDFVACRTGYAVSKAMDILMKNKTSLMPGFAIFRYENCQDWKAAGFKNRIERGDIGGISGKVIFSDGLPLSEHPEVWDSLRIELVPPYHPKVDSNPVYRKSIDIFGMDDGTYIFPDLPADNIYLQALADGWSSEVINVNLYGSFPYLEQIDFLLTPD